MTATYRNKATGETYSLGIVVTDADRSAGETPLSIAWGRGFKIALEMRGWQHFDTAVVSAK